MAGRRPKAVVDAEQDHLSKAKVKSRNDHTPIYEKQNFEPPKTLSAEELVVWNRLAEIFHDTRNCAVSDADRDLMELYCRAKVTADKADAELKKDDRPHWIVVTGKDKDERPKTTVKPNPWYKIRNDASALCLKYFDQLGLSPVARARTGLRAANAAKEEQMWADLCNRSDD